MQLQIMECKFTAMDGSLNLSPPIFFDYLVDDWLMEIDLLH